MAKRKPTYGELEIMFKERDEMVTKLASDLTYMARQVGLSTGKIGGVA